MKMSKEDMRTELKHNLSNCIERRIPQQYFRHVDLNIE
jgi:hypothetical protein